MRSTLASLGLAALLMAGPVQAEPVHPSSLRHIERYNGDYCDASINGSNVTLKNENTQYTENVKIPEGFSLELVNGKLRINDKFDSQYFRSTDLFVRDYRGSGNTFYVMCEELHSRSDFVGYCSGEGSDTLQGIIDNYFEKACDSEFEELTGILKINGKRLKVRGPDRLGRFELSSKKSSILYNPLTDETTLHKGWNERDEKAKIISGSVKDGSLKVECTYDRGLFAVHDININFGNIDRDCSYTADLVDTNIPK